MNPVNIFKHFICPYCHKRVYMSITSFGKHKKLHDPKYRKLMQPVWNRVGVNNSKKLTGRTTGKKGIPMTKLYGVKKANRVKRQISKTLKKRINTGEIKKSFLLIGNGKGMSRLETFCYDNFLDSTWIFNYGIGIKPRIGGYPNAYKIDFYNTKLNIGLEVDGKMHLVKKQQELDAKKTKFLNSRGYRILRITELELTLLKNKTEFNDWITSRLED